MNENEKNETKFDYTYSAPTESERREIESIKKLYSPPQEKENKLEDLCRLNNRVIKPPDNYWLDNRNCRHAYFRHAYFRRGYDNGALMGH